MTESPLTRFLGSYFHQDFALDTGSVIAAVCDLRARTGEPGVGRVYSELTALLSDGGSEAALLAFLERAGVELDVVRVAGSAYEWLSSLLKALR